MAASGPTPPPRNPHGNPWPNATPGEIELAWALYYIREEIDGMRASVDWIQAELAGKHKPPPSPDRITLALAYAVHATQPQPTEPFMPDTIAALKSTDTYTIPLGLVDAADSTTRRPIPAGDVFTASSSSAAVSAVIGVMPAGVPMPDGSTSVGTEPAVIVNALTLPGPNTLGILVAISDSAGDVVDTLTVNYPVPPEIDDITATVADAVIGTQPAPTAAAP